MPAPVFGIDFGTSNSAVALATADGGSVFAEFDLLGDRTRSFRSLLFFDLEEQEVGQPIDYAAGPQGIEAYLQAFGDGRLMQSFKTHLTSTGMGRTRIGPHTRDLDGLIALFLRRLCSKSRDIAPGEGIRRAVLGRPVRFAGGKSTADDDRAEARLVAAAKAAGIEEVQVELEPTAAAFHYESKLEHDELALVADFGAGTTDFCVMRLGPSRRSQGDRHGDVIATRGIGVAGDDLDAALMQNVVAPQLGKGSYYREWGKAMVIPPSYYNKLAHWHQLSFLRGEDTQRDLERLRRLADQPQAIEALMSVIEDNQGFHLHKAVEATKVGLSRHESAAFHYVHEGIEIDELVLRSDFEAWIAPEVEQIVACLDACLAGAGLRADDIDRVFMTGGTAFVPSVRREFEARFGAPKLSAGDELTSIASGLAARGAHLA